MKFLFFLTACLSGLATASAANDRLNVAILVWPGAELLDFAGPAEVFAAAGQHRLFHVYLVGLDKNPTRAQGSVTVQPEFTLADCPAPDVIVIPGGNMQPVEGNAAILNWVKQRSAGAQIMLSVCTGAFVLAEAGLLDGSAATTHHFGQETLASLYPRIKVVRDRRYVDNGKFITAGGVSAGIDAALHVVEKLAGRDVAEWTANEWMEYRRYPVTP